VKGDRLRGEANGGIEDHRGDTAKFRGQGVGGEAPESIAAATKALVLVGLVLVGLVLAGLPGPIAVLVICRRDGLLRSGQVKPRVRVSACEPKRDQNDKTPGEDRPHATVHDLRLGVQPSLAQFARSRNRVAAETQTDFPAKAVARVSWAEHAAPSLISIVALLALAITGTANAQHDHQSGSNQSAAPPPPSPSTHGDAAGLEARGSGGMPVRGMGMIAAACSKAACNHGGAKMFR
jgi:hypothetical protein